MRRLSGTWGSFRYRIFAVLLVVIVSGGATGQTTSDSKQQGGQAGVVSAQKPVEGQKAVDGAAQKEAKDVPKSPEEERQAQLVADTNKLYQLAQELKVEVAKSNKDTLSVSVIKKATEVEKLAKSLKERMRKE